MTEVPEVCRWAIHLASWLVPAAKRKSWRDHRKYEVWTWWAFLSERGELTRLRRREIYRYCLHSFPEALWVRFQREDTAARVRSFLRGPAFALALPVLLVLVVAAASGGFQALRSFYNPLPYANPHELALVTQERALGSPHAVQPHAFAVWQAKAKSLQGIAAFGVLSQSGSSSRPQRRVAGVTTNFFEMIGVRPRLGRLLQPGDEPGAAVLTHWFWRAKMGADPQIVGKKIVVGEEQLTIIGVLPADFGLLPRYVEVVVPMDLDGRTRRVFRLPSGRDLLLSIPNGIDTARGRHLIGAIARVRPGVSFDAAGRELAQIAKADLVRYFAPPRLTPLEESRLGPLIAYLTGLAFAVLIGLGMVQVRKPSFAAIRRSPPRSRLYYWGFFAAKTLLLQFALFLAWVETSQAFVGTLDPGFVRDIVGIVLVSAVFLVLCALAVYWSVYDQRWRCPECLERLMMPVRIGSWASPLLEPVTIEVFCEKGHGALVMGQTASSEADRWTRLDASWRELFNRK
ncbi:MAG TPA: ABC transporter permease [Bryobacteraceae bacterium]|nr:ABC transporter permease [Bryobacteraceae bacterium]